MTLYDLKENLRDLADMVHPNINALDSEYLKLDEVLDFIIYEAIKYSYDTYAEKKSLRKFILEGDNDPDVAKRQLSRNMQYAKYYRTNQKNAIFERTGRTVSELEEVKMSDKDTKFAGYEINKMHHTELMNMNNIRILKKIAGRQICDTKKVSNTEFVSLMEEYDRYIDSLEKAMNTPEDIIFNTQAFFTLEWKYCIDAIYDIVLEAEKNGYPPFEISMARLIVGSVNIPCTSEWYRHNLSIDCRLINARRNMIPLMFISPMEREKYDYMIADMYRLINDLPKRGYAKSVNELVHNCSMEEQAEFLRTNFNIWKNHTSVKEWNNKRIRYARDVYSKMLLDIKPPEIK